MTVRPSIALYEAEDVNGHAFVYTHQNPIPSAKNRWQLDVNRPPTTQRKAGCVCVRSAEEREIPCWAGGYACGVRQRERPQLDDIAKELI